MADKRFYIKLDVGYFTNPKVAQLRRPTSALLHIASIAYARQHLTNGIVPIDLLVRLTPGAKAADVQELYRVGLWHEYTEDEAEVHDYSEHQQSAEDVAAASKKGRIAAQARWGASRNASSNASGMRNAMPEERRGEERRGEGSATLRAADDDEPTRPEVEALCEHLADRIEANGSKRPTVTKRWHTSARLLLDADHRTPDQVRAAIDWCQADEFWRTNILSMPKLREKYDQLRLAASRRPGRDRTSDILRAEYAWAEQAETDAHPPAIGAS